MPGEKEKGILTDQSGVGETAPTGINHLLVIAIDDYLYSPKLSNCVKDAKDFAHLLWERYQFEKADTYFLLDGEATRRNILNTIRDLRTKVKETDSLVIYYSGHGQTVDDVGYWVPADAAADNEVDFVSTLELKPRLDAINSFHTFLIADACFSGSLFLSFKDTPMAAGENKRSRWGLAASHSREKALDGTPGENSPFAERLLKNLRNNTESLGIQKLAGRLIDEVHVTSERKQTPVFKPLNVRGDDSGQFVFRLKQEDEARFWAQCLSKGSISAFREYLTRFPNGVYTKEAGEWIKALAEESGWEKAAQSGSIDALLDFLEEFPRTRFRKEAREKIEYLEDLRDWKSASGSEKIADYLEYKEKHPAGKYVREADERIAVLRSSHREADAWRKAQNEHSERGYSRYLEAYPEGANAVRAKLELDGLRDRESREVIQKRDDAAWSLARDADEMQAYRDYLTDFLQGRYRREAAERIAALEQAALSKPLSGEKPASMDERKEIGKSDQKVSRTSHWLPIAIGGFVLIAIIFVGNQFGILGNNRELKAFNEAVSAQTIPAMEDFLKQYPDGKHAAQIEVRLKSLEEKLEHHVQDASVLIEAGLFKDAMALLDTAERINPGDMRIQGLMEKAKQ